MPAWLTLLLGTVITAAPQFIEVLPPEIRGAATAISAMGTSVFHLYAPSPLNPAEK
jgi:hypothetical protein